MNNLLIIFDFEFWQVFATISYVTVVIIIIGLITNFHRKTTNVPFSVVTSTGELLCFHHLSIKLTVPARASINYPIRLVSISTDCGFDDCDTFILEDHNGHLLYVSTSSVLENAILHCTLAKYTDPTSDNVIHKPLWLKTLYISGVAFEDDNYINLKPKIK